MGCFLGLAIGDALGSPVEFRSRGSYPWVKDYAPTFHWDTPAGVWTDDTAMALCLADSILSRGHYDSSTTMDEYLEWFVKGKNTPRGQAYGIGHQVGMVLEDYRRAKALGQPYATPSTEQAGNGCIMRLAPVALATFGRDQAEANNTFRRSAQDTHNSHEAIEATLIMGNLLRAIFQGIPKEELLHDAANHRLIDDYHGLIPFMGEATHRNVRGEGYVRLSLQAAWHCFEATSSFGEALEEAVNLGDDTDTTGAVTGQLAGAYYGAQNIPPRWLDKLWERERIENLAIQLIALPPNP